MDHQLLSEIHSHSKQWTISVLVSRLWFYRGGTDNGPIKHMDLVVLDSQGNHMYVQIPPQPAQRLQHELQEGKVYMMTKFLVNDSKTNFRAVESPYMIQFTRFTHIVLRPGLEADYPFCTYNLVPFQDIPRPGGPPVRFIDVIGRITAVSDVIPVQSMHQPEPSDTRTIILSDLQGQELKLVLWGNRAVEFEEEAIRARDEKQAVIAIFVGTLPKMNQGVKGLSGSSACRWYIDEDLPVINDFRNRLGTNFKPVETHGALDGGALSARVYEDPIEMTLSKLLQLDPFENSNKRFICTVTVQRMNPDQRWWFFSCSKCNKTSALSGSHYRCSNINCKTIEAQATYCLSVFACDDKAEAEFMLFDKVAKGAVEKPLFTLLKQRNPGYSTIEEIGRIPMVDRIPPPEVTRIVGQKYKVLVSISSKSFAVTSEQLSFQVVKIMETYKPELSSSAFDFVPDTTGASSSALLTGSPVPSGMLAPNTPSIYPTQPDCSSGSLALGYQTAPGETAASKLSANLLPPAPPGKSPCPTKGTRRALFQAADKKATAPQEVAQKADGKTKPADKKAAAPQEDAHKTDGETKAADKKAAAPQEVAHKTDEETKAGCDGKSEPSSLANEEKEEKDEHPLTTKNKRNSAAGKGLAAGKKSRQ